MNVNESYAFLTSLVNGLAKNDEKDLLVSQDYPEQAKFICDRSKFLRSLDKEK